ncbi:hypothetical protein ACFFX0_21305 [Citricoccus parietis]|uniref:Uncharacterized protein n=1 Tax=Citricoccus parietis TaxID=592307 RepID=A0ABV5G3R9_9MICC
MMSAPRSPSSAVQYGPARARDRSITVIPASGRAAPAAAGDPPPSGRALFPAMLFPAMLNPAA